MQTKKVFTLICRRIQIQLHIDRVQSSHNAPESQCPFVCGQQHCRTDPKSTNNKKLCIVTFISHIKLNV